MTRHSQSVVNSCKAYRIARALSNAADIDAQVALETVNNITSEDGTKRIDVYG